MAREVIGDYKTWKEREGRARQAINKVKADISDEVQKQLIQTTFQVWMAPPVQHVWALFWQRMFSDKVTHDALLHLLLASINKPSFICDSTKFGQEWIEFCV